MLEVLGRDNEEEAFKYTDFEYVIISERTMMSGNGTYASIMYFLFTMCL